MKKFLKSFGYAFVGFKTLILSERNAQIHIIASIVAIIVSLCLGVDYLGWCLIVIAIVIVWITEALNTSIEKLCNKVTLEHHPIIKQVKDIAAAAVLIAATGAVFIAVFVWSHALSTT